MKRQYELDFWVFENKNKKHVIIKKPGLTLNWNPNMNETVLSEFNCDHKLMMAMSIAWKR